MAVSDYNRAVKGLSWSSYVTILRKWLKMTVMVLLCKYSGYTEAIK